MGVDGERGEFGEILRRMRIDARLSQEELAERARLSVESISALERGRRKAPYRATVKMIADALGAADMQRRELEAAAKRGRPTQAEVIRYDGTDQTETLSTSRPQAPDGDNLIAGQTNLLRPLGVLYGRQREIAELAAIIAEHRLLTLVGAGGIGKTRIAIQLGWDLRGAYPNGTWFVDLAPVSDPSLVTRSVIDALRIPTGHEAAEVETLKHHLEGRHALIIVDNCEHVIDEVAALIAALLAACPYLRVITTSREFIRVTGEQIYRIPSLDTPPGKIEDVSAKESLAYAAVALFVDRSKAANSAFVYDDSAAPVVARLCRRLDGIALAIELAASRVSVLAPRQILEQLEARFEILSGRSRSALPRQKTMHETIRWSYDRLNGLEQRLFRAISIFAGGLTWNAVSHLADTLGELDDATMLGLLTSLIEKSLVVADISPFSSRYRLLEPMRDFGLAMVAAKSESDEMRRACIRWCIAFAQTAHDDWSTVSSTAWIAEVEPELQNLRASLIWALEQTNDITLGQRLVSTGRRIWARLMPYEGMRWISYALRFVTQQTDAELHGSLKLTEAHAHLALQHYAAALRALEEFERIARPDELTRAEARCFAGSSLAQLGRTVDGESMMIESIAVFRAHGAKQLVATGVTELGIAHLMRDQLPEAHRFFREALRSFRELGNDRGAASTLANIAEVEYAAGNFEVAIKLGYEALATSNAGREGRIFSSNLAAYLVRAGRYDEARERARESILRGGLARADAYVALALQHLSAVAVLRETPASSDDPSVVCAASLLGYVDERLTTFDVARVATEVHEYEILVKTLRSTLGTDRLERLRNDGRHWDEDRALSEAMTL